MLKNKNEKAHRRPPAHLSETKKEVKTGYTAKTGKISSVHCRPKRTNRTRFGHWYRNKKL